VLDDVQRRRFLVEPSGKDALPLLIRLKHVDLHERSGELLLLPRCRGFAGAQVDEHVLPPHRLARVQCDVLDDAVALVEDSENRDALRHRRHAGLVGHRAGRIGRDIRVLGLAGAIARSQSERERERNGEPVHAYSGIQGS
jgi:hypothetical protein